MDWQAFLMGALAGAAFVGLFASLIVLHLSDKSMEEWND